MTTLEIIDRWIGELDRPSLLVPRMRFRRATHWASSKGRLMHQSHSILAAWATGAGL